MMVIKKKAALRESQHWLAAAILEPRGEKTLKQRRSTWREQTQSASGVRAVEVQILNASVLYRAVLALLACDKVIS